MVGLACQGPPRELTVPGFCFKYGCLGEYQQGAVQAMASRFTLVRSIEAVSQSEAAAWPEGFMPGTVAPFVMRYGTDFLVAMQRAAAAHDAARPSVHTEIEPA